MYLSLPLVMIMAARLTTLLVGDLCLLSAMYVWRDKRLGVCLVWVLGGVLFGLGQDLNSPP